MSQSKPRPPSYADMIDLPDDPIEASAPVPAVDPVPAAEPVQEAVAVSADSEPRPRRKPTETKAPIATSKPATRGKASAVPSRRELARLRRMEPKPEPADYAQRSLYAREETFERFRQLAFTNKTAAQALYREGLYLVLQKYGQADGLTVDDM